MPACWNDRSPEAAVRSLSRYPWPAPWLKKSCRRTGRMARAEFLIVYWDTSAILSSLFSDRHSALAIEWARADGVHLLSSLAYAEAWAVIGRLRRERILADILIEAAAETLHHGPWRRLHSQPDWKLVRSLAEKWPLRGADLWHLATARNLKDEL